jgi:Flp pilus assembly protein TadG
VQRLQRGAVAVEFALVAALFLLALLVGIIELGRAFFYMNATAEATRLGARIAVVCDKGTTDGYIRARMQELVSVLPDANIAIQWEPANCTANGPTVCRAVTVSVLPGATYNTFIPFVPLTWTLPPFATTLPRESMQSAVEGESNPVCN